MVDPHAIRNPQISDLLNPTRKAGTRPDAGLFVVLIFVIDITKLQCQKLNKDSEIMTISLSGPNVMGRLNFYSKYTIIKDMCYKTHQFIQHVHI